ncbi:uncharacterized protein LOC124938386 isoform X2 [Impatiens glandulifera]|uniref:uncharacterized protein LOC124938386 isoform X2 n=1 Tax=Impatiens glandulifera TaxID=253017 RepID=UPI001FB1A19C|nr:uncharacterized protein LOC124938386 isoform X2 [Impatiens glandulifera]
MGEESTTTDQFSTTNCTDVHFDHQESPPRQYSGDHSEEEGGDDNNNNENSPNPPVEFSEDELTLITRMFNLVGKSGENSRKKCG